MTRDELRTLTDHPSGTMTTVGKQDLRGLLDALDAAERKIEIAEQFAEAAAARADKTEEIAMRLAILDRENARLREAIKKAQAVLSDEATAHCGMDAGKLYDHVGQALAALATQEPADGEWGDVKRYVGGFTRAEMDDFRHRLTVAMQDTTAHRDVRRAAAKFLDLCDEIEKHALVRP